MAQDGNKLTCFDIQVDMVKRCLNRIHIAFFVAPDIFVY